MTVGALLLAISLQGVFQHDQMTPRRPGSYLMDFKTVTTGDRGESVDHDVVVAHTLPQWEKLRVKIGVPDEKNVEVQKLHGPLGAMDWGREQVVFARTTQQRTGGYSVSVQRVTKFANSWRIDLVLQPPPKDMLTTLAPLATARSIPRAIALSLWLHPASGAGSVQLPGVSVRATSKVAPNATPWVPLSFFAPSRMLDTAVPCPP